MLIRKKKEKKSKMKKVRCKEYKKSATENKQVVSHGRDAKTMLIGYITCTHIEAYACRPMSIKDQVRFYDKD